MSKTTLQIRLYPTPEQSHLLLAHCQEYIHTTNVLVAAKESRWMKNINHQLSRHIVNHAHEQGVGTIKVESLAGIRKGTTRPSGGARTRKNNRLQNSWSFYQLTLFISYKAERLGMKVEQIDPAYTSQECPACSARNKAQDRTYVCAACGWMGHRDSVGAINISRRAGLSDKRVGATGA